MIKKLNIKNFRSHLSTELFFSRGLNVIVGRTRSGKSNIIRAIRFAVFNQPLGSKVVYDVTSFKDREAEVGLTFFERLSVYLVRHVRYGKKKDNVGVDTTYEIRDRRDQLTQSFEKMKFSVPDEISNLINLSELNFQSQLSPHFMVTSSGGQITKEINRITEFEKIDKLISFLTTSINHLKRNIASNELEIEDFEAKLLKLKDLYEVNKGLSKLKDLETRQGNLQTRIRDLHLSLLSFKESEKKVQSRRLTGILEKVLKEIDTYTEALEQKKEKYNLIIEWEILFKTKEKLWKKYEEEIEDYFKLLQKAKKCPVCFSPIGTSELKRIRENETLKNV